MTKVDAIEMANNYLVREMRPEPKIAGERCELIPVSAHVDINRRWRVLDQFTVVDSPGSVVDSSLTVIVDPATGEVQFDELNLPGFASGQRHARSLPAQQVAST
ncbi:hypothetical protein [Sorangium sp. So ce204]|uniref:hypothetical protein n=1 Tax=Sorangium sp. So ce204 TaxID=3133288 RepID=UPI003F60A5FA